MAQEKSARSLCKAAKKSRSETNGPTQKLSHSCYIAGQNAT
jgi:hypothetical protein